MAIIHATDQTLEDVIKKNRTVLVDFWAPWCGPCRMISPILDELDKEIGDQAVIAKVNVDENPMSAIKYQIQGIPTLRLFAGGLEVENFVGVQPLERLKNAVLQYAS